MCGRGRLPPLPPAHTSSPRRWRHLPAPQRWAVLPPSSKTAHGAAGPVGRGWAGRGGGHAGERQGQQAHRTGKDGPAARVNRCPAQLQRRPCYPSGSAVMHRQHCLRCAAIRCLLTLRNSGRSSPRAHATGAGGGGAAAPLSPLMAIRGRAARQGRPYYALRQRGHECRWRGSAILWHHGGASNGWPPHPGTSSSGLRGRCQSLLSGGALPADTGRPVAP